MDTLNALRVFIGHDTKSVAPEVAVLAANIDDMTGEAFRVSDGAPDGGGALDVSFVPMTMKKPPPGLMAQVVARVEDEEKLGNLLLNESTTLGGALSRMRRMMQKRRFERVSTESRRDHGQDCGGAPAAPARNTNRRRRWRARTMCLI